MSNEILDLEDKYSGPRTCPNCGHQFPFEKFVNRFVMSFGLSKFSCQNCGAPLKCDYMKIQLTWGASLIPIGILFLFLKDYLSVGWLTIISLAIYMTVVLVTLYHAKFKRNEL